MPKTINRCSPATHWRVIFIRTAELLCDLPMDEIAPLDALIFGPDREILVRPGANAQSAVREEQLDDVLPIVLADLWSMR